MQIVRECIHALCCRIETDAINNYHLLSVRDSSLVVIDASDDANENSFTHAEILRCDSIYRVYREPNHLIKSETARRITAASVGAGLEVATYFLIKDAPKDNRGFNGSIRIARDILGITTAFLGTALILKAIFPDSPIINSIFTSVPDKELKPIDLEDKEFLREISRYPNGEPEMLKLVH